MKAHWNVIDFNPSQFQLNLDDADENISDTNDVVIKTNNSFTPPPKQTIAPSDEKTDSQETRITGVVITNLPENIPEIEAVNFLKTHGLENKGELKIHHNKKNTNIDIEDIGDVCICICMNLLN